jgi:hypothetical protein
MKFKAEQLALLKDFVNIMKLNPAEIHNPDLKFFKDWIERYVSSMQHAACAIFYHVIVLQYEYVPVTNLVTNIGYIANGKLELLYKNH